MEGYGRRYASSLANNALRNSIGFALDTTLRQDPRFFRSEKMGFLPRLGDAVIQTLVTRKDGSGKTFATWRVGSAYGAGIISNAWRPDRINGVGDGFVRGSVNLGIDTLKNVYHEFWPDIKRKVFKR